MSDVEALRARIRAAREANGRGLLPLPHKPRAKPRKHVRMAQFNLCIPRDLHAQVKVLAAAQGITEAAFIRAAVAQAASAAANAAPTSSARFDALFRAVGERRSPDALADALAIEALGYPWPHGHALSDALVAFRHLARARRVAVCRTYLQRT